MKALKVTILASALIAGFTAAQAQQNADEIFAKHYNAIGGDNWNNVKSMKSTGTADAQGMSIEMTNTTLNNKANRQDITMVGTSGYTIVTNTEGWSFMPMMGQTEPEALKDEDIKGSQEKLDIKSQNNVDIKANAAKSEIVGKEKIGDMECIKVKVTDKDNNEQTMYFDPNSYYLVCLKAKTEMQGQSVDMIYNFSDFKKLDAGIVVPMKIDMGPQGSLTFTNIEVNKPIDESIFKPSK